MRRWIAQGNSSASEIDLGGERGTCRSQLLMAPASSRSLLLRPLFVGRSGPSRAPTLAADAASVSGPLWGPFEHSLQNQLGVREYALLRQDGGAGAAGAMADLGAYACSKSIAGERRGLASVQQAAAAGRLPQRRQAFPFGMPPVIHPVVWQHRPSAHNRPRGAAAKGRKTPHITCSRSHADELDPVSDQIAGAAGGR